jgi:uncharacterized OB-fold protein
VPDPLSAGYWDAAARHVLAIAKCGRCDRFAHPPESVCPHCGSIDPGFTFEPVSGRGTVKSWTTVRQALLPGFAGEVPYLLVDVELDEQPGLRMTGRLLDRPGTRLQLAARVQSDFEDLAAGVSVPAFRLAAS